MGKVGGGGHILKSLISFLCSCGGHTIIVTKTSIDATI